MECFQPDEFRDNLDKCSCGRKPQVRRFSGGYILVRCQNPNCGRKIKPQPKEWQAMVEWNKMIRN